MTLNATRIFGDRLRSDQYQCRRCGLIAQCHNGRTKPLNCRACHLTAETQTTLPDQAWTLDALCAQVGPELWFPEQSGPNLAAKAVCARCDVRAECLAFALATNQAFGVWGGLSAVERRALTVGGASFVS